MAKMLLADDSLFMRKILRKIIENAGHVVIGEACDGSEAIKKYIQLKPDLVFMDITMEHATGLEALREIKVIEPGARVIICSAMGQDPIIYEAYTEGAIDFIIKPFKKEEVINTIRKALINNQHR